MLDAGRSPQRIGGLTVFFDHADDTRRYVVADRPRLLAAPDPQLSLVVFRGQDSGGLLQFETQLAPGDDALAAIARELSGVGRPPVLMRPDWRDGTIQVAGWLQAAELAPRLLVVGTPSLTGDPRAVVSARLDAAGTALAEAALRGNALPTVVIFSLETLGLAGPLSVDVEADLQALHDRLSVEGALTTPYGRARIAATWESAARDNLIRIRVVDESGDVDSDRAEAMRRVGEELLARMFSPFPPPERPPQLDDGSVAPLELSFALTLRREELATTARWSFRERRAVVVRHYAAASLIDLLGDSPPSAHISFVDLAAVERDAVVRVEPELARLGMTAVEVDLQEATGRDSGDRVERTVVLTDGQPEVRFLRSSAGDAWRYRVRARFDPTVTRAADRETEWMEASGNLVSVSARRLFPPRLLGIVAGRVEFDWIERVEVTVQPAGDLARVFSLTADTQSVDLFLPAAGAEQATIAARWLAGPDEPSRSEPPVPIDGDLVVLDSPFADSINVLVVPLPQPDVMAVVVELRTDAEGPGGTKTISWNAPDREPQRVGLRRLPGSRRQYAYRTQLVHDDGSIDQRGWTSTDQPTLVVGADEPMDVRTADVVVLGGGPAGRDSVAIELVLEAGSARASELLEGTRDTATLVLPVPRHAPPPVLTAREFTNSGAVRETTWTDPPALTVIASPTVPF